MRMFGTNGVRGVANEYMDCELAIRMGRSIGRVLGKRIAIAYDPRTSSRMITDCVSAGLMSVGSEVIILGIVPTPALQYFVKTKDGIDGGVMVTASHNPPEFNGIKCIAKDGTECTKEQEDEIEEYYHKGVDTVTWDRIGTCTDYPDAAEDYLESILSKTDVGLVRRMSPKVVLDCANGCSCVTSPRLLESLGCEVTVINGAPDMREAGHNSEPTEDNLSELKSKVIETGADLGIAHDGDADRVVFISSSGRYVPGDLTLAILGKYALKKEHGKVVITVATSMVVEDCVEGMGGETIYTAVGSPIVARRMAAEGALFGGEENGGLIFAEHQFCRDGAKGAAKMLECIAKEGSLDAQLDELPRYRTIKAAVRCPDDMKDKVVELVANNHPDAKIDRTDGLKLVFDDGWVLLRPSGTEPKFRVYSESRDQDVAESRSRQFVEEVKGILD